MIEGLRVYPHYQDARKAGGVVGANGCEECKATVPLTTRQQLGCGWEPALPSAQPWRPQAWVTRGIEPTVCPGYSTSLPAVGDVIGAYCHWENGTLTEYLDGDAPTRAALDCLAVFRGGMNEHMADRAKAGA